MLNLAVSYHKRSLLETAMFRVKKLLGGTWNLREHNNQISEINVMIKALNEITGLGMSESIEIV
ncbi:Mobile element protein [Candidatus Enterovibrio altilux]|uniref:Mobile element protein n=1 Tax=Candidatus Enterovibrio altilux TaxID=1927128 RepID=A0A291B805_9GAMM|nr:Mobile element protein [Candidatus Enterovibrio luxaltus]